MKEEGALWRRIISVKFGVEGNDGSLVWFCVHMGRVCGKELGAGRRGFSIASDGKWVGGTKLVFGKINGLKVARSGSNFPGSSALLSTERDL